MSEDTSNPYKTPSIDLTKKPIKSFAEGGVSKTTVWVLSSTKIWVRIMGGLGYAAGGLMVIAGLFALLSGSVFSLFGVVYIAMSLVYFVPAYYLMSYASGIEKLERDPTEPNLNNALRAHKAFWKFVAVSIIVIFAVYFLLLLPLMFFG